MTQILDLTLDESDYGPRGIDRYILDYRSTMFFCVYGKGFDYFGDHEHETYEYELDVFYNMLELFRIIQAFDVAKELLNTFLMSDYVLRIIDDCALFGDWGLCRLFSYTWRYIDDETPARDRLELLVTAYEVHRDELHTDSMY